MSAPARRSPVARLLLLAPLLAVLLLVPAGPASAHTSLRSSTPAADAQLTAAPTQVQLVFTDTVLALGTQVVLTGPDGEVAAGEAAVDGDTVTAPLPDDLPGGAYEVAWRVTAEDGHPISGTFTFTYTAPAVAPAPTPPTSEAPAPTETPTGSATPTPEGTTEQTSATGDDEGSSTAMWVALGVVLVAAVGGGGTALARRRT